MINQLIADHLKTALHPITGISKPISRLAGLVKVLETDRFDKDKKVRRFPVPVVADMATCSSAGGVFPDLVPNQKERLIIYFEDVNGSSPDGGKKWVSRLRLVAWGNTAGFNQPPAELPARLIASIKKQFDGLYVPPTSGPVSNITVAITGTPAADAGLFNKYTYSETHSQYLLFPFFSFGLDLSITCVLNDHCSIDLTGLSVDSPC